ncbi:hypothetical protein D3C73_1604190 [compost metagenome]
MEAGSCPLKPCNPVHAEAADVLALVAEAGQIPSSLPEHQPVRINGTCGERITAALAVFHLHRQPVCGADLQLLKQMG